MNGGNVQEVVDCKNTMSDGPRAMEKGGGAIFEYLILTLIGIEKGQFLVLEVRP